MSDSIGDCRNVLVGPGTLASVKSMPRGDSKPPFTDDCYCARARPPRRLANDSNRCAADIGWLGMDDSNGSFTDTDKHKPADRHLARLRSSAISIHSNKKGDPEVAFLLQAVTA